jgi:ABC-type branched-subunit amino acid transport system substrate-binding protein
MTWYSNGTPTENNPDVGSIVKASAQVLNASGGINGHPVTVVTCNTQDNPNIAESCAREAVTDHVVAVVGEWDRWDSSSFPVLEAAQIPCIGCDVQLPIDTTSPISFPTSSGGQSIYVADGYIAAKQGCKRLSILEINVPAIAPLADFIQSGWESQGHKAAPVTLTPAATADMTAQVTAATANGTDCVTFIAPNATVQQFMSTADNLGLKFKVISVPSQVTPAVVSAIGAPLNGSILAGWFAPLSASGWAQYKHVADVSGIGLAAAGDQIPQNSWVGFEAFEAIAKELPTVTGPALIAKMDKTSNLNIPGLSGIAPNLGWAKTFTSSMPRLFTRDVFFMSIQNGTLIPMSPTGPQDMTPYFPKA